MFGNLPEPEDNLRDRLRKRWVRMSFTIIVAWEIVELLAILFGESTIRVISLDPQIIGQILTIMTVFFGFTGIMIVYRLQTDQSIIALQFTQENKWDAYQYTKINRDYFVIFARGVIMLLAMTILVLGLHFVAVSIPFSQPLLDLAIALSPHLVFASVSALFLTIYLTI